MNKRGQITLVIIIGILILILAVLAIRKPKVGKEELTVLPAARQQMREYLNICATEAIIRSNVLFGMKETTKEDYQDSASLYIKECMSELFPLLTSVDISEKDAPTSSLEINEKNLILDVDYPLEVSSAGLSFIFEGSTKEFSRVNTVPLPDLVILSSDTRAKLVLKENTTLKNLTGATAEDITLRIENSLEPLEGKLIYQILPEGFIADKPMEVYIRIDDLDIDIEDLRIAWRNHGEWGFLPSEVDNGFIKATVWVTTDYGLMKKPESEPAVNTDVPPQDPETDPSDNPPPGNPPPNVPPESGQQYGGDVYAVFDQIKSEMGGTYELSINPACTAPPFLSSAAYCITGYSPQCGLTAVHCKAVVAGNPNPVFRHEITHNLQQINKDCIGDSVRSEWGADYIAGTTYYTFRVGGQAMKAHQLAQLMKQKGCTDSELRAAAVCSPGAYDVLAAKGCLLENGRLATF